ncbi:MAG: ABC transporter permease, partial [Mesorhizobium sp.]
MVAAEAQARARLRKRHGLVIGLRLAILVVFLGLWELCADYNIIDPFFFSSPSGIWEQIWSWITEGTSQGPLWLQIYVTLE